jgi:hypothetical protein
MSLTTAQEENVELFLTSAPHNDTSEPPSDIKKSESNVLHIIDFLVPVGLAVAILIILILSSIGTVYSIKKLTRTRIKNRKTNDSYCSVLYQNTHRNRNESVAESVDTLMNRPLPLPPGQTEQPVETPKEEEEEEEAYLEPTSPFYRGYQDEIRGLPPAPPVFPEHLANRPPEGEGAYIQVLPDDAPTPPPQSRSCEISSDVQSSEMYDEEGYIQPRQYRDTPDAFARRSSSVQLTSTASKAQNRTESANGTERRFRSTLQIQLSPPTYTRSVPVSNSQQTVVVYIQTNN